MMQDDVSNILGLILVSKERRSKKRMGSLSFIGYNCDPFTTTLLNNVLNYVVATLLPSFTEGRCELVSVAALALLLDISEFNIRARPLI
jgi:hypothetical protein